MYLDIVDLGFGNLSSIQHWVSLANVKTRLIDCPTKLSSSTLLLPGVGSAGSYLSRLRELQFDEAVREHVDKGGRLIGICLGFQAMAKFTEEDSGQVGLSLIDADVIKMTEVFSNNQWHTFSIDKRLLRLNGYQCDYKRSKKRKLSGRVFFNHEYGLINHDADAAAVPINNALSRYSSLIVKNNILGMQFHPEKSQQTGAELIRMIL